MLFDDNFAIGRVRIAHVPYAKSLAIEKKKVTENAGKSVEPKTADNYKTAAQTAKSGVRVAHVPQVVCIRCFRTDSMVKSVERLTSFFFIFIIF